MANTFDIRFARSGGLGAFLQAPANSFRWKGVGRLSIDAEGISIAVRRGLLSLFPRSRRVAAADLEQVLREGDALRVEFKTSSAAHAVVPFWVRDANTAEQIVRLLPTTHTVELEHDAAGVGRPGFRPDWRSVAIIVGALALATLAAISMREQAPPVASGPATALSQAPAAVPPAAAPRNAAPSANSVPLPSAASAPASSSDDADTGTSGGGVPLDLLQYEVPNPYDGVPAAETQSQPAPSAASAESPESRTASVAPRPENLTFYVQVTDGIVPVVAGMSSYPAARRQLDLFLSEMAGGGDLWSATVRIYHEPDFDDPGLWPLRDMELSVASARRDARSSRNEAVQAFADRLAQRVHLYVR